LGLRGHGLGLWRLRDESAVLMHGICAWSARSDDSLNEGSYSREPLVCGLAGEAEFFGERGHPRGLATLE
jgi:hypothetical protein